MYFVIKTLISAIIIVAISEVAKRNSFVAAIIASLPLVSILAIIWLYAESKNIEKVAELSTGIFWVIPPSLIFFILLPFLLKWGVGFVPSLIVSIVAMSGSYWGYTKLLSRFGIDI